MEKTIAEIKKMSIIRYVINHKSMCTVLFVLFIISQFCGQKKTLSQLPGRNKQEVIYGNDL